MRRLLVLAAAVTAALSVSACGDSKSAATPPVTTPSSTAVTSSSAAPPSASTAVDGDEVLKLGQAHQFTDEKWTAAVTALQHQRSGGLENVQVRTCNKGNASFPTSSVPWLLSYDGGEQLVDDVIAGGGLLSPQFVDRDLGPGKCAKGWISYQPPKTGKPDGVEYRVEGVTSARWEW
jgi:hypothetical protein